MPARTPNTKLQAAIVEANISHASLASRINARAATAGHTVRYTHRSVANWTRHGTVPQAPIRSVIADVLAERLGRWVALAELGFHPDDDHYRVGLHFPRDPSKAIATATEFWSRMDRGMFLTAGLSVGSYTTPVRRWLTSGADPNIGRIHAHHSQTHVGPADIEDLLAAADDARRWDSRFGGGNWRSSALTTCLTTRAAPLLHSHYSDKVGRVLFNATAQLSRVAGWTAFDNGQHGLAQRHYIQALRLARAAGDLPLGGYVLVSMALQASLRNFHDDAIDMAQAAVAAGRDTTPARVLGFYRLIEARAHARAGDVRNATHALSTAETLLDRAESSGNDDPRWIDFFTPARLASDAVEVFRDLKLPKQALAWNSRASSADGFTRSAGLRGLILATVHLQEPHIDLEAAVQEGHQALDTLTGVTSSRALDYASALAHSLMPWRNQPAAKALLARIRGHPARPAASV